MVYAFGEFTLDDQLYQLRRAGEAVKVEPQVFKLLTYLIVHRDRVVSREELFEQLWPGQVVSEAALTYCMAKARKAVHDDGIGILNEMCRQDSEFTLRLRFAPLRANGLVPVRAERNPEGEVEA
jgi:DNA-binding response OmpR family regulator